MLLAGIDVSGDTKLGDARHIGFVVGTEEAVNSLYNKIGLKEIHMIRLDDTQKNHVQRTLDFTSNNIRSWCFYVERQNIVNNIFNNSRLKKKPGAKSKIYEIFDKIFFSYFRKYLETFVKSHSSEIPGLNVQCDADMDKTIRRLNMQPTQRGKAYEMADAIAWLNEHNRDVAGCATRDLTNFINKKMESSLLK